MYIVVFEKGHGSFGPFETLSAANEYLALDETTEVKGRVVALIKPYGLGKGD